MSAHERPLHEQFLLLAIDDESGKRLIDSNALRIGLAGAALIDLKLIGALDLDVTGRKERLRRTDADAPGDPLLAEIAERVDGKSPSSAVSLLVSNPFHNIGTDLEEQGQDHLVRDGVLEERSVKLLGLFPSARWPTRDPAEEAATRARVQAALSSPDHPDERTGALVSLLWATGLVKKVFPGEPTAEQRAEEIAAGNWAAGATKSVIASLTAAVIAGAVAGGAAISGS